MTDEKNTATAVALLSADVEKLKKQQAERPNVNHGPAIERLTEDVADLVASIKTLKAEFHKRIEATEADHAKAMAMVSESLAKLSDENRALGKQNATLKGQLRTKKGD